MKATSEAFPFSQTECQDLKNIFRTAKSIFVSCEVDVGIKAKGVRLCA